MTASNDPHPLTPRRELWQAGPGPLMLAMLAIPVAKKLGRARGAATIAVDRIVDPRYYRGVFSDPPLRRGDVVVATFAKSGTNWMMQMAQQVAYRGAAEFDHIHQLVPWPDAPATLKTSLADDWLFDRSPTGNRIVKTHMPVGVVPYLPEVVYLSVLRDPKEVVVSAYHFFLGILGALDAISFDEWFDMCMGRTRFLDHWAEHTAGFWNWRERPNAYVATYPEALAAGDDMVDRVASLMGVELTEAERAAVAERSGFQWMKENEKRFAPGRTPFASKEKRPKMIRRGKAGGSGELMSESQQAQVDAHCTAALAGMGSDFPYAEKFPVKG